MRLVRRPVAPASGPDPALRARRFAFQSGSLALEGEVVTPPEGARVCVLLCHGIPAGGPPSPPDEGYGGLARALATRGFASAWFDFRGARSAPGDFSILGWRHDLDAALDALAADRDAGSLARAVVGSSAGGAVAICAAAERGDLAGVATLAAPASWGFTGDDPASLLRRMRNAGLVRDPSFPRDVDEWWAEFDRVNPERAAGGVAPTPLLIVHGDADGVVPYPHAERIYASARAPKEIVRIPNGAHQLRRDARAVDAVCDWLSGLPAE